MRAKVVLSILWVAAGVLLLMDHFRLRNEIATLRAEREQLYVSSAAAVQLQPADERRTQTEAKRFPPEHESLSEAVKANRIAALEKQVQTLTRSLANSTPRRVVPEYDPTSPIVPQISESPVQTEKRGWSSEQIVGAPDTEQAGDHPTAWASRQPDAGPEWLWVDFENQMNIAEVRIRESLNPGAISKVTAMVNGQEKILWQGAAATGPAPRDFVIRPTSDIWAQTVVVHLDTARVAGWNEIDAVELVGRDGSRQWAKAANASSTYAER